jgi:hypothetical protein
MRGFLPIIDALNKAGVRYVVVGGVATVLHGHPRTTADVDIVIALDTANVQQTNRVLSSLDLIPRLPLSPDQFADAATRESWVHDKGMVVFSWVKRDNPVLGVDLFATYPIDFDGLISRSVIRELEGVRIRTSSLSDLIAAKVAAGRPRDVEDVRVLRIIQSGGADAG